MSEQSLSAEKIVSEQIPFVRKEGQASLSDLKIIRDITETINKEAGLYIPSADAEQKTFVISHAHRMPPIGSSVHTKGDNPVFFHSHHKNPSGQLHFVPSFQTAEYIQAGSGDIPINNPNIGGMLNTVNPEGMTLCIGVSDMPQGEKAAIAYLEHFEKHGELEGSVTEKVPTLTFFKGGKYSGVVSPNIYSEFEQSSELLDEKGMAVFSVTDKHRGKEYMFLALTWEQVDQQIPDLTELCYGTGLQDLASKLDIQNYITGESLREVLNQTESQDQRKLKIGKAMGLREESLRQRRFLKKSWPERIKTIFKLRDT